MNEQDSEWTELDNRVWEKTYMNGCGDLLYVEDTYKNDTPSNQTRISDYGDRDRYAVVERKRSAANENVVATEISWDDAEAALEEAVS